LETGFSEVIASEVSRDCLLISVGLPGSWKSPVTEEIANYEGISDPEVGFHSQGDLGGEGHLRRESGLELEE